MEASSGEKAPLTWEITPSRCTDLGSLPSSSRNCPCHTALFPEGRKEAAQGTTASFPGYSCVARSVLATASALAPSRAPRVPVKGQPGQSLRGGCRLGTGATALPREVTRVGLWMRETPPGLAVIHTPSLPGAPLGAYSGRRAGNGFLSAGLVA